MAITKPCRYILEGFDGVDDSTVKRLLKLADKKASAIQKWQSLTGVTSTTKAISFNDGIVGTIAELSDIRIIRISAPVQYPTSVSKQPEYKPQLYSIESTGVVDFISGKVDSGSIVTETVTIRTDYTRNQDGTLNIQYENIEADVLNRFTPTSDTSLRYSLDECRYRLAIPPDRSFGPPTDDSGNIRYSQYTYCRPSQYSGSMKKVVQLLLGLGKIIIPNYELLWMEANNQPHVSRFAHSDYPLNSNTEVEISSGFNIENPNKLKDTVLLYDYRFQKTHGISFTTDGKEAMLVEISPSGVYAMPLYMDPVSQTVEGQERYIAMSPELEEFVIEMNGIPLFKPFPSGSDLIKYINAGEVIQLLGASEISVFYSGSAFSSDIGWTFDSRGNRADNCCSKYADPGFNKTFHYKIRFSFYHDNLPELLPGCLNLQSNFTETYQINKCRRMTIPQLNSALKAFEDLPKIEAEQFFEDIVVDPTRICEAVISEVSSGIAFHGANPEYQPQIKYPESLMNGLISFDFGAFNEEAKFSEKYAKLRSKQNAPMFVCYIADEIHIINYFTDYTPVDARPTENTRIDCQFEGRWVETSESGSRNIMGHFYSNVWDTRIQNSVGTNITEYNGIKYGTNARAYQPYWPSMCVFTYTQINFIIEHEGKSIGYRDLKNAVAIPAFVRDNYAVCTVKVTRDESKSSGYSTTSINGPVHRSYIIYDPILHWFGGSECSDGKGADCIARQTGEWQESACSYTDDAAANFFYYTCPETGTFNSAGNTSIGSISWGGTPLPDQSPSDNYTPLPDKAEWEIKLYIDSPEGKCVTLDKDYKESTDGTYPDADISLWWFTRSPASDGSMAFMAASQSCLGEKIVNYHTDLDGFNTKSVGSNVNMHGGVYTVYTGVIK